MKTKKLSEDFIKLEKNICPVCGITHSHNCGILFAKNLGRGMKDEETVTDFSMCKEHSEAVENGFIHLVVIDRAKSEISENESMGPNEAYRTGDIITLKKHIAEDLLKNKITTGMVYIDQDACDQIKEIFKDVIKEVE